VMCDSRLISSSANSFAVASRFAFARSKCIILNSEASDC
jgi:hypothetical protein